MPQSAAPEWGRSHPGGMPQASQNQGAMRELHEGVADLAVACRRSLLQLAHRLGGVDGVPIPGQGWGEKGPRGAEAMRVLAREVAGCCAALVARRDALALQGGGVAIPTTHGISNTDAATSGRGVGGGASVQPGGGSGGVEGADGGGWMVSPLSGDERESWVLRLDAAEREVHRETLQS